MLANVITILELRAFQSFFLDINENLNLFEKIFYLISTLNNFLEPKPADWIEDVDRRVKFGVEFGKKCNFIKTGDALVVVTGWKEGSGFTNTMRIM